MQRPCGGNEYSIFEKLEEHRESRRGQWRIRGKKEGQAASARCQLLAGS